MAVTGVSNTACGTDVNDLQKKVVSEALKYRINMLHSLNLYKVVFTGKNSEIVNEI